MKQLDLIDCGIEVKWTIEGSWKEGYYVIKIIKDHFSLSDVTLLVKQFNEHVVSDYFSSKKLKLKGGNEHV